MNVFQKLSKAAENNHGLQLEPTQVRELVVTLQAMQGQMAYEQGRLEAQTRILSVALNQLGGSIDIPAELFGHAENYIIDVEWDEEGNNINASIRLADVGVPEVSQEGATAPDSDRDSVSVLGDTPAGREDDDREADQDEEDE